MTGPDPAPASQSETAGPSSIAVLATWSPRRWAVAGVVAVAVLLVVAVATDLVDTPLFSRMVPAPWWAWPALALSSALGGVLAATYVREPVARGGVPDAPDEPDRRPGRQGWFAGALTFFAVGCPVCNKLVLLALGTSGAMTWFEPAQPLLQLGAVALLAWALRVRLRGEAACSWPPDRHPEEKTRA